jgi:hypothetical protein
MAAWPPDFERQLAGEACPLCVEGRPNEASSRVRFFASEIADAYLHRHGVQRGYAAVIWRGRHVAEPTDLTEAEATAFWLDVLKVGRAMQAVYQPLKMNYALLGNRAPHLHCWRRASWTAMSRPATRSRPSTTTTSLRTRSGTMWQPCECC